ncbi:hypothetical protein M378DRAFT_188697 [Amanita muscaria Koide BX008]|uniref:Uncharacterized protein n=1 Tax=Amanita muscaria (strain Koide BX008) TaxID=946122 RepID=A0A0C2SM80_AMAMK|nr:hypothetical protein M378DRAFT_188697 [Amanita muscaria Koide BX008]
MLRESKAICTTIIAKTDSLGSVPSHALHPRTALRPHFCPRQTDLTKKVMRRIGEKKILILQGRHQELHPQISIMPINDQLTRSKMLNFIPKLMHLYETIDAIEHGDVSWESFTTSYNGEITEENDAPWRHASYEIWYRDPLKVLKNQLSNRDFAKEMDFAPKKVYDSKTGKRQYQDFMSGEWAWRQADIIAQDEENHGATFCPIVLGSDKTTVSVATGQNEYYPVYLSNGLIHNNVHRAHRNGVTLIAFLAIPKTDQEHQCCDNFRRFRRALYHSSLRQILSTLRPGMTKSQLIRFVDGHYRRVITGLGPYIGDYPEQVQLACVVQGWCTRCTATRKDLDGPRGRRTHELTATLRRACTTRKLWKGYGIIDGIMPFTYDFPRANIHELLSPDLLHQLVKGVFKDHLVTWVEAYIRRNHPPVQATRILAEIDRRIAAAPLFPDLRRFKEGRGFKQWTGKDSKAFMKVYLAAIAGLVLPRIVRAVRYFLEFCYHVRRDVIDDDDLEKLDELLVKYQEEREVFREEDVRPTGFNLPRQHSLTHYRELIIDFGAPNGLCSSITESKHIDAVKDPYRRSNRNDPLSQILLINQRMDKLSAARIDFTARGMLQDSLFQEHTAVPPDVAEKIQKIRDEDDDGGSWDGENIFGEALMAKTSVQSYPRRFEILINYLGIPSLREDVSRFLYELDHPNMEIPLRDVPIAECPAYTGNIFIFPSAIAIYRAPSDLSGLSGMYHERIRSTASWRSGPERRDCVYVVQDQDLPGFRGLYVAQVRLFFKIRYKRIVHACAWVSWFKTVGDEPCSDTGMWRVEPEYDKHGDRLTSVILLDTILRASHLIGIAGEGFIPHDLKYTDSLTAFNVFYVNKYIDYHAHETVF